MAAAARQRFRLVVMERCRGSGFGTLHIATLDAGKLPPKLGLTVLFAPTGPIQEVSISSGWGEEFLSLAEQFDRAVSRAYRWSLWAAIRFTDPAKRRAR